MEGVEVSDELEDILDRMEQQSESAALPRDRGEVELSPQQFNAAKVCLEYEQPKLTAVAIGHMDQSSFAAQLERCLKRSAATYVPKPALLPAPEQHPASELKRPFTFPRRNLR